MKNINFLILMICLEDSEGSLCSSSFSKTKCQKYNNVLYDEEILYLITDVDMGTRLYGDEFVVHSIFSDSGCLVVPRSNRDLYQRILKYSFEKMKMEKVSVEDFLKLGRVLIFVINDAGQILPAESDWSISMDHIYEFDVTRYPADSNRMVLIPKKWKDEIDALISYQNRKRAVISYRGGGLKYTEVQFKPGDFPPISLDEFEDCHFG
jgi:hypothetical protein